MNDVVRCLISSIYTTKPWRYVSGKPIQPVSAPNMEARFEPAVDDETRVPVPASAPAPADADADAEPSPGKTRTARHRHYRQVTDRHPKAAGGRRMLRPYTPSPRSSRATRPRCVGASCPARRAWPWSRWTRPACATPPSPRPSAWPRTRCAPPWRGGARAAPTPRAALRPPAQARRPLVRGPAARRPRRAPLHRLRPGRRLRHLSPPPPAACSASTASPPAPIPAPPRPPPPPPLPRGLPLRIAGPRYVLTVFASRLA